MKVTELMIGDLVFVQGELSKIIEIHEHSVLLQGRSFYFGEEDIKSIPLTPEILEKNGFEKSSIQTAIMIEQQIPPCIHGLRQ